MKIIEIKIIRESNLNDFEKSVNELLSTGWKTKGNLIIQGGQHYQKMKKKTNLAA
jgi:hypothetical protein